MSNQKNLTELWWEKKCHKGVAGVLSDRLDDDALFWTSQLLGIGAGPYPAEDLIVVFHDPVTDGGSRAFIKLVTGGLLVSSPNRDALVWSDEIKQKALAAFPVPEGWSPEDKSSSGT